MIRIIILLLFIIQNCVVFGQRYFDAKNINFQIGTTVYGDYTVAGAFENFFGVNNKFSQHYSLNMQHKEIALERTHLNTNIRDILFKTGINRYFKLSNIYLFVGIDAMAGYSFVNIENESLINRNDSYLIGTTINYGVEKYFKGKNISLFGKVEHQYEVNTDLIYSFMSIGIKYYL